MALLETPFISTVIRVNPLGISVTNFYSNLSSDVKMSHSGVLLVWLKIPDRRECPGEKAAHPLLVVDPPLVILLDHHLNPFLPVAALQHNCLVTGCRNTKLGTFCRS